MLRGSTATPLSRAAGRLPPTLLVAVGGFVGAVLRHLVGTVVADPLTATLAANVAGSFALGLLLDEGRIGGDAIPEGGRLAFGTGLLSSFTTYSTFVLDAVSAPERAAVYVVGSYACGFGAVLLAGRAVRALRPTAARERGGAGGGGEP